MLQGVPDRDEHLTEQGLEALLRQVRRMGVGKRALYRAAKAAGYRPSAVWTWYLAGQDARCPNALWRALAWEVDQIRADRAAKNAERIEKAADAGEQWAILHIEKAADEEAWEASPGDSLMAEIMAAVLETGELDRAPSALSLPNAQDAGLDAAQEPDN